VAEITVRVLPFAVADGAHNMAADEALLRSAADGRASLRFYCWSAATLSLGYFQPEVVRRELALAAELPCVRRPSGGATLVHHHEVTYCLALPAECAGRRSSAWQRRMHRIIEAALSGFGVHARLHEGAELKRGPVLCFQDVTPGDLILDGAKVAGSAQRRRHGALLQHGAVMLAQSPFTPELPGIRELVGLEIEPMACGDAMERAFAEETGWVVREDGWTDREAQAVEESFLTKYANPQWTAKR
jgi:lipoate-protein ligase A